ncbi:hypothetical protein GDO86_000466 [Hymenochirus boettgeri]|uniref:Uncharacterized protein n=1 Tax=Hymenochirus boettgeri TaxID=247094 RepID=A0A8T2KE56_9PIPI|nr:hypothetical protein GDO86_000466 [Hymenochirus boettgeri]
MMEASLTCAVCLGLFREPVTLPLCSHNFCKHCLQECAAPDGRTVSFDIGSGGLLWTVQCPLCRKVSSVPGGVSSLPVNTTLAEVVRILGSGRHERDQHRAAGKECGTDEASRDRRKSAPCGDHPDLMLELYCKNCSLPCCGKCVSDRHQGVFHSINLLEMVYQEEKLTLFSSLKRLREIHEKFSKEPSEEESEIEEAFKNEARHLNLAFEEVQKALDLKKQQFLELIQQQQNTTIKEYKVWQQMQTQNKKTIESLLKDCERIVDEFEPNKFLKVACDLNKRMKSSLDLMGFTSDHSKKKWEPTHADLKPALEAISALNISGGSSNDNCTKNSEDSVGNFSFKIITRSWKHGRKTCLDKYSPIQGEELEFIHGQSRKIGVRYICISEMPKYKAVSYEELRLKCYEDSTTEKSNNDIFSVPGKHSVMMHKDKRRVRTDRKTRLKVCRVKGQDGFDEGSSIIAALSNATTPKTDTIQQEKREAESTNVKKKSLTNCNLNERPVPVAANCNDFISERISTVASAACLSSIEPSVTGNNQPGNGVCGLGSKSPFSKFVVGSAEVSSSHRSCNMAKCHGSNVKKAKSTLFISKVDTPFCPAFSFTDSDPATIGRTNHAEFSYPASAVIFPFHQLLNTDTNEASGHLSTNSSSEEFFDANSNSDTDEEKTEKNGKENITVNEGP